MRTLEYLGFLLATIVLLIVIVIIVLFPVLLAWYVGNWWLILLYLVWTTPAVVLVGIMISVMAALISILDY